MAAPTVVPLSYSQANFSGNGTKTWAVNGLAANRVYVEGYARDNRYSDALGTVGGLTLSSIGLTSVASYDFGTILYHLGLSGYSGNNRTFTTAYSDQTNHMSVTLQADAVPTLVTYGRNNVYNAGWSPSANPGTRDCLAVLWSVCTNRTSPPPTPTVSGKTVTSIASYTGDALYNFSMRLCTVPILASDGAKTIAFGYTGSAYHWFNYALFGVLPAVTAKPQVIWMA